MHRGPRRNVCRYYMASGHCQYGDQCQFLHVRSGQPAEHRKPPPGPMGLLPLDHRKMERHPYPAHQPMNAHHQSIMPRKATSAPAPMVRPHLTSYSTHRQPHVKQYRSGGIGSLQPPPPAKSTVPKLRPPKTASGAQAQVDAGGTTYFYSPQQPSYMADYTAFVQQPTHIARNAGRVVSHPSFFASTALRKELLERQSQCRAVVAVSGSTPSEVDTYHSLCPLEQVDTTKEPDAQHTLGHPSTCYRATSFKDGLFYCLRRLHGVRLTTHKSVQQFEKWRRVEHVNLVALREMFTTKAFGDNSVVFVYDYIPGADTLHSKHLEGGRRARAVQEDLLWDYLIQLVAAIRVVHGAGLALHCLNPSKILVTGLASPRLGLNCAGIMDILTFDASSTPVNLTLQQQQDLVSAGQLLLAVALQSPLATQPEHFHQSLDTFSSQFSPDIFHIVQYFLQSGSEGPPHNIVEVLSMIGGRVYHCLERVQLHRDWLEAELSKEVENGRLFRLLAKLGTVTERPEFDGDPQWSETGDRYLLKLFRDYLFHQVLPSGAPWVDLAHIVQSLNKLDAGVAENIMLHSRDEQSILIVSYADLKACIEETFTQLTSVPNLDTTSD